MDVSKWRKKEHIITYIKPLKCDGDSAMPTTRCGANEHFCEWQDRQRRVITDEVVIEAFERWLEEQEDKDGDTADI